MKKLILTLAASVVVMGSVLYFKSTTPTKRNNTVEYSKGAGVWWDTTLWSNVKTDTEWILDPEIPVNYVPVIGLDETYMVLNDDGTVNRYRKRVKDDAGNWVWSDVIEDDMPVSFIPSIIDDDIYTYIGSGGEEEYYRYVRNGDDSYAFVPVDENGNDVGYEFPKGDSFPENFVLVEDNLYASLDDHGVIIKLWERYINELGAVKWQELRLPYQTAGSGVINPSYTHLSPATTQITTSELVETTPVILPNGVTLAEGQTCSTETYTESKTTGGWKITYETVYTYIYNTDGSLFATYKDGPNEIERVQVVELHSDLSADAAAIEPNIQAETIRVTAGLTYKRDIAASVLAGMNDYRTANGAVPLAMSYDSDAGRLSEIFAADMAKYNYGDIESPLYGTIEDLAKRYGINKNVSINVWRCAEKSPEDINKRLQSVESSRNVRMDGSKTEVGISIVAKDGFFYIAEIFTD